MKDFFRMSYFALLVILLPVSSYGQGELVTSGFTSTGGYSSGGEFDFAIGQVVSFPIDDPQMQGAVGVLQVIPAVEVSTDQRLLEGVSVSPTASSRTIRIADACHDSYPVVLTIVDRIGRSVLSVQDAGCTSDLDISSLQSGLYFLIIRSGDRSRNFKIIKT